MTNTDPDVRRNPIDLTVDAALELEELRQGLTQTAPSFDELIDFIRTPSAQSPAGGSGISMLADYRAYPIFRESIRSVTPKFQSAQPKEFQELLEKYFENLRVMIGRGDTKKIEEAKRFCLAFNSALVARTLSEIYSRRERSDSRYISHEPVP